MYLTNHRRRINAARRDPMIQQRQYFARRREQNQQNARRQIVGQTINSFRRLDRAPRDNNRDRRFLEEPLPIGTDCLVLANPSANDSVIEHLRQPKRPRLEEPRREKRQRVVKAYRDSLQELNYEASNDIRVFDGSVEKTNRFRRRVLPHDFLNSEITEKDLQRSRRGALHSRNITVRGQDRADHGSVNKSKRVVQRRRNPTPTSTADRMDHVVDMRDPLEGIGPLRPPAYSHIAESPNKLRGQIQSRVLNQLSSSLNDGSITRRLEDDEFVEATPPDDEGKAVCKDFLLGISPSVRKEAKSRTPTAEKLLSKLTALSPHFPPVKIDSDSSESRAQYRTTKCPDKGQFRSLLCNEDIASGQFSADVQELEGTFLNRPDRDVPFLFVSKMLAERKKKRPYVLRNTLSADGDCNILKEPMTKPFAPTFVPDVKHVNRTGSLEIPTTQRFPSALDADNDESENQNKYEPRVNPESRNSASKGIDVGLCCDVRNPVAIAADGAVTEMTENDGR